MKITSVEVFELKYQYDEEHIVSDALGTSTGRQGLLIKITNNDGLYGVGEAWSYGSPTRIQRAIIEDQLAPTLIGEDPTNIQQLYQRMYWRTIAHGRRGLVMGAISGLDIALWDLLGKIAKLPIYKLLGAHSNVIPSYACGGFYSKNKSFEGLKKEIHSWLDKGYQVFKIKVGRDFGMDALPFKYVANKDNCVSFEEDLERVELLRSMVGNKKIIIDFNASWDAMTMKSVVEKFKELNIDCIEEPFQFEDTDSYNQLRQYFPTTQLMGFETEQNPYNFSKFIDNDVIDIIEPDVGWCGGITAVNKIAHEAEAHFKPVSMHSFGSAVHFAASLQIAATMPNLFPIESETNFNPLRSEILKNNFVTDNKMNFILSDKPGLGIDVDWNQVKKFQKK